MPEAQSVDNTEALLSSTTSGEKALDAEPKSHLSPTVPDKTTPQPSLPAPAVNIWQLRKEKMKSSSGKQSKSGGSGSTTGKTVFNSLTDAASPPLSGPSTGKKSAVTSKPEEAQGKRQTPGSAAPISATASTSAGKTTTNKTNAKTSAESIPAPTASVRRDVSVTTAIHSGSPQVPAGSSTRLADDQLWPDIATLAVKNVGSSGKDGKKKEKEDEENARPTASNAKKGEYKRTVSLSAYVLVALRNGSSLIATLP
jgi:hypothetical protein